MRLRLRTRSPRRGIDPLAARTLVGGGEAIMLDVREPAEWAAARVAGALHIPLGELTERIQELPRDTKIIVVCRTGRRSALATRTLRRNGHAAENLAGGLEAWRASGLPLQEGPA
jgi:rhodanese-related sulfurtransferase